MAISDTVVGNLTTLYLLVIAAMKVYGLAMGRSFTGGCVIFLSIAVVVLILIASLAWDISRKAPTTFSYSAFTEKEGRSVSEGGSVCNSDESRTQNESHVKLSHSKDEVVDEGSEASAERYAIIALNHYNSKLENFELVDTGPLAVGNISNGRRVFHFNYNAEVQTFSLP